MITGWSRQAVPHKKVEIYVYYKQGSKLYVNAPSYNISYLYNFFKHFNDCILIYRKLLLSYFSM